MSLWIDRVDVRVRSLALGQHLHESATVEVALDVPLRTHQDTVAVERPIYGDFAIISCQVAAYFYYFRGSVCPTDGQ